MQNDIVGSTRGGSRAAATSKMERFVIIVNGFQPLTIITKRSILDTAEALDPPLSTGYNRKDRFAAGLNCLQQWQEQEMRFFMDYPDFSVISTRSVFTTLSYI